jgi:hypothetical protein
MNDSSLQFNPDSDQLTGPAGSLPVASDDLIARRFLMLMEGQCLDQNIVAVAEKHGLCRQRYYQLLEAYQEGVLSALLPKKTGPKANYRRTDQAVRQVLRHLFLDPEASPEVVAQKLCQTHFPISRRSVQRVIADYGLQKKTLRTQSRQQRAPAPTGRPKHPPAGAAGRRRSAQRRKGRSSTAGR